MKRYLSLFAIIILLITSCTSKKKISGDNIVRDGSSFEKAIIIDETHEHAGIDDEYVWVRKNYPGSHTKEQALLYHDKKSFDLLHVVTADGKDVDVYFDISKFFGKF